MPLAAMKEFCDSVLMNGLSMAFDDDILSPFSDQKTLNELHDATDLCEEFDIDPSISLFNFNDDVIMHDYLFSGGTSFGGSDPGSELQASPIAWTLPKKNVDTLPKDADPIISYSPRDMMRKDKAPLTALPSVEEAFGANFKNVCKPLPRRSSSSSDYCYASSPGRTYAVMNNTPYFQVQQNGAVAEIVTSSNPDIISANHYYSDTSSNHSSSSSGSSSGSGSDCSLSPEDSKDMVVLGVDISNLMHDYAMKPPQRQFSCPVNTSQYYHQAGNINATYHQDRPYLSIHATSNMSSAYSHPNLYSSSALTLATTSCASVIPSQTECIVVKTGTSLLRKSNAINISNKSRNSQVNKLPHGAGHRMTANGIDPMLSNYQVQGSSPSPSGSPHSTCSYDGSGSLTLSSSPPSLSSPSSSSPSDLLSSVHPSSLGPGIPGSGAKLEDKVYPCTYPNCNKVYSKSSHLKAHLRRHTGEKPFHCSWPDCGWKFSRSDELARHKRSHSGVKPYKCDLCTKCFSRSDHLSKHRKVHKKNR